MNAAAALTVVSVLVALAVGVRSHRLGLGPGTRELRWFTVVVLASAAYALCNLSTTLPGSPRAVALLSGVELSLLAVLLWGWIRFSQEVAAVTPARAEAMGTRALLAIAPVFSVPGLLYSAEVRDLPFPLLDVVYRQGVTTPLGDATLVVLVLTATAVLVRLVRAARRGVPGAACVSAGYATMLAFAAWDAVCSAALVPNVPFVLDWGFAPAVLAVDWVNTSRVVQAARALERLRAELETQVHHRTRELSTALDRLHHAEKLVSLGRFANGVAHQVNNPAAVVAASLSFLADRAGARLAPEEADALGDARAATERISSLVRRLVDAAQVAEARPGYAVAEVEDAVARVVGLQPTGLRARVRIHLGTTGRTRVRMRPDAFEIVVDALVRNALDAAGPRHVEVAVERAGDQVRLTVAHHGAEPTPELLERAFDPFFSTAAQGRAGGVGLAVARGLAQANGGTLVLERAPGAGTRAVLALPEEPPAGAGQAQAQAGVAR